MIRYMNKLNYLIFLFLILIFFKLLETKHLDKEKKRRVIILKRT